MNFLGLDIGTSRCKAVVFDEAGNQLAMSFREYGLISSQEGWAELDSNDVVEKCFQVIKESAAHVPPNSIFGMGISSQGEAFTPVDKNGKILCNAMVSSDVRAIPHMDTWKNTFDVKELYQITGHSPHPMFTLYKLLWLKENRNDIWQKADKFLCYEDLVHLKLGLQPTISHSLAGRTMIFNVRTKAWSDNILSSVGLSSDRLAKPVPSGSVVGKLAQTITTKLGLSNNIIVVAGGHDQVCGALGAGITKPGMAMYATGTVECFTPIQDKAIFADKLFDNNLCTYNYGLNDTYCTVAYSLTGGNILRWYRDEFGALETQIAKETGKDVYRLLLNHVSDEPSKLLILPYFTPSGTPYFDIDTKGVIMGLRLSTKKGEFIRALLEGVSYEMKLNMEILEGSGFRIDELRAVGGGAKSKKWAQLKADVLGKKIQILEVTEAGCMGAAMLACSTVTKKTVDQLASEWVKPKETILPKTENKDWYDSRFKSYKKLYELAKSINL
jgi:xylulokinase